jgi:hypothetical protein
MPAKKPLTVEKARKRLTQAIQRHANAAVERSWSGAGDPKDRPTLIRAATEARIKVTWAIQDFEEAIRAEVNDTVRAPPDRA